MVCAGQLTSLALIIVLVTRRGDALVQQGGPCPQLNSIRNFNLTAFMGQWFELLQTRRIDGNTNRCIYHTFEQTSDKQFKYDAYSRTQSREVVHTQGVADIIQVDNNNFAIQISENGRINLVTLLDTDYKNFAVLWSCIPSEQTHYESSVVLTRARNPSLDTLQSSYDVLAANNVELAFLLTVDQRNCPRVPVVTAATTPATGVSYVFVGGQGGANQNNISSTKSPATDISGSIYTELKNVTSTPILITTNTSSPIIVSSTAPTNVNSNATKNITSIYTTIASTVLNWTSSYVPNPTNSSMPNSVNGTTMKWPFNSTIMNATVSMIQSTVTSILTTVSTSATTPSGIVVVPGSQNNSTASNGSLPGSQTTQKPNPSGSTSQPLLVNSTSTVGYQTTAKSGYNVTTAGPVGSGASSMTSSNTSSINSTSMIGSTSVPLLPTTVLGQVTTGIYKTSAYPNTGNTVSVKSNAVKITSGASTFSFIGLAVTFLLLK